MSTANPRASVGSSAFDDAVTQMKGLDLIEVAFAAELDRTAGTFTLGGFLGTRTDSLHGLVSGLEHGLGGKCVTLRRPVFVADYAAARGITHQHDRAVAGEGLRAVVAVPVLRERTHAVQGVVYGAARRSVSFGERWLSGAVDVVHRATRPRHDGAAVLDQVTSVAGIVGTCAPEDIREVHAELRVIADEVSDPVLRGRLRLLGDRLCRPPQGDSVPVALAPRELDVLAEAAVGCGNAAIARRLGLTVETVKSYLKSAMCKLDSHNRVEAVHRARHAGLLP